MGVAITPVTGEQAEVFLRTMGATFGFDPEAGQIERFVEYFEWDRARTAFDGDQMVGTIGAFSLDMTVPGATMPCAGTTVVAVLPSHRRRGILRMMMDSHLDDARQRQEPIAALWASDSAIYGRFGFGAAVEGVDIEIRRHHTAFHRLVPSTAPVRLIDEAEARTLLQPFYASLRREIPGFFRRSDAWWRNRHFLDEESSRKGYTAYRYAVAEAGGEVTGYVQYRYKSDWSEGHGMGEVRVRELLGSDPPAWSGLWRFILDHDLTSTITAANRSVEDPVLELLAGRRRASRQVSDSLWIRIMDPKAALEGRSYSDTASVVVELHDPLDASLTAWRLDLSPDGAEVSRTDSEPSVHMDTEDLGACFMGWSRFRALAAAGRLSGDPPSLAALDRAFAWSPLPWCPEVF